MIFNPEFQRNLWLEFSPFKLVAAPVMVLCMALFFAEASFQEHWQGRVLVASVIAYFGVVFLWGNYAAASSAPGEGKGNTWDFQRMSSLGPWELMCGKLFGATSFVWYFGFLLLALIGFCHYAVQAQTPPEALAEQWIPGWLYFVLVLIFSGVAGHAAALLISLYNFRYQKSSIIGAAFIGFFVSVSMFFHAIQLEKIETAGTPDAQVMWYAWHVPESIFIVCSIVFFMFWIIMGAQRMMREELQYKNTPVMWVLFCATTAIYVAGTNFNLPHDLIGNEKLASVRLFLSYVFILAMSYLIMFSEAGNLSKYKRWAFHLKQRMWAKSFEHMPAWCAALVLLVLPLLIAGNISGINHGAAVGEIISFSVALLLFAVRDGLVVHALLLGKDATRTRFKLIFYYAMAYGILPALCLITYQNDLLSGAPMFFPTYGADIFWSLAAVIIEVLIALLFLLFKLQHLTPVIEKKA